MDIDIRERLRDGFRRVMEDPEEAFQFVKRATGLAIGLAVMASGVTFGIFFVQRGAFLNVFVAAVLFWAAYLLTHYIVTGVMVHQKKEEPGLPSNWPRRIAAVLGLVMLLGGITAMAFAAARGEPFATGVTVLLALVGYVTLHYGLTAELL